MSGGNDVATLIALAAEAGSSTGLTEIMRPVPPRAAEAAPSAEGAAEVAGGRETSEEALRTQAMQVHVFNIQLLFLYLEVFVTTTAKKTRQLCTVLKHGAKGW